MHKTTLNLPPALSHTFTIAVSTTYHQEIAAAYTNPRSNGSNAAIIAYLSLSCGLNAYLTAHIVFCMFQMARTVSTTRVMCHRIAFMFIQSALFYLVPTLVFIALCAERSFSQNLLFPIMCQIQASSVSRSCALVMQAQANLLLNNI